MVRGSGFWKTLIKAVAVGEVIIFLGSYRVWHQMNTSRDYRKWMRFYKAAEIGGYVGAREADAEAWSKHTTDAKT
ncbi:hypothetical protein P5673_032475 [Acropora cervicornis]|uniref:Uncharacterized protein n=1 Tax=Acropora cervicornis TaxID=6130 RepID=A0AAD9PR38_ACRCE|nr:hypothetical protein P5673_032475 [Acropora cervicornis]